MSHWVKFRFVAPEYTEDLQKPSGFELTQT